MYSIRAHHVFLVANVHVIMNVDHLPVAINYSVADRFLPEPCGGSIKLKGEIANHWETKQES